LKLAVPEDGSAHVERLWEEWSAQECEVVAPALLWYEVTSVLRNRAHRGALEIDEAKEALDTLLGLPVAIVSPPDLHQTAWELATVLNQPAAYDAHYLAVAQSLGCPFWTADGRLYRVVAGLLSDIHLIE